MEIRIVNIESIIPYERNPRKNDSAVKSVSESIKQCEYVAPIVVDENSVILCGHTRLKALKLLGYKEVEVCVKKGLTEEQKRKYRILDNKVAEIADWDLDLLFEELKNLDFENYDFGFDIVEENPQNSPQEDDIQLKEEVDPRCKEGDVWQLGEHRLICGDCLESKFIGRLLEGKKAAMAFTDPPYGYQYQSNQRTKSKKFEVIKNDDKIIDFFPVLKNHVEGFVFVCTSWKVLDKWIPLFSKYYELTNMLVWNKGGGGMGDLTHTFVTDFELILVSNCGKSLKGKRIGCVWDIGKDNAQEYEHATQKPVELAYRAIEHTTEKGDIVIDLFGGSGSTLIACEQLERKCYMTELDPRYCDVIIKRWENFTGRKAVLNGAEKYG